MKKAFLVLGLIILSGWLSCGRSSHSEERVYDTQQNPYNFPAQACSLLDSLENRELTGYDAITAAFSSLYENHVELLDDKQWHDIIRRLGGKFARLAQEEVEGGILHFSRAAGYYRLASFAKPDDERLAHLRDMFSCWSKALDKTHLDSAALAAILSENDNFAARLEIVKNCLFVEDGCEELVHEYLLPELFPSKNFPSGTLSFTDSLLASAVGILDTPTTLPHGYSFADSAVELVSYQVLPLSDTLYRAEVYFFVHKTPVADYTIALRGIINYTDTLSHQERTFVLPLDLSPEPPTSRWRKGTIVAEGKFFTLPALPQQLAVGLYVTEGKGKKFASIAGSGDTTLVLPITPPGR